ncbi:MAG: TerB N-terminal domain-containing protein [Oscillospiraceae bacterium]|jgi:hypothetical protein|nr:TerB N-terminal domain-containing protein [Oscillospiraceae bacterium]
MVLRGHEPFKLPERGQVDGEGRQPPGGPDNGVRVDGLGSFAELELRGLRGVRSDPAPAPEPLSAPAREIAARFRAMRRIAGYVSPFQNDAARVFFEQASFMRNFEDDYGECAPFSEYYPSYQKMSHRQLRTYFTWRARVRRGEMAEVPVSYAFVYIYELLNNIGVDEPAKGFDMLVDFWRTFRGYGIALERYMPRWLKDYYIYYALPVTFQSLTVGRGIAGYYPEAFAYGSDERTFEAYSDISSYDIRKSRFYNEGTAGLARDCFIFVLDRLRSLCEEKRVCFEDMVFYRAANNRSWKPFAGAVFYYTPNQPDRRVAITRGEKYVYLGNHCLYRRAVLSDHGKRLVGYIMKAMESELRRVSRFKHSITARPFDGDLRDFEEIGVSVGGVIRDATEEFYAAATRMRVSVDARALGRIRREAADTRDRLLAPEDEIVSAPASDAPARAEDAGAETEPEDENPWERFLKSLTRAERNALTAALQSRDIAACAEADGVMPEVLADGINQKAADILGDVVLEFDGAAAVYEDYREILSEHLLAE